MSNVNARGDIGQDTYVIEECSELIKALTKKRRGKGHDTEIIDEACDVLVTVSTLLYGFGVSEQEVKDKILFKCNRAINRFNENGEV